MSTHHEADRLAEQIADALDNNPMGGVLDMVAQLAALAKQQAATPSAPQAAGATAWEYENEFGNKFLTYSDPNKWHEHDKRCFKNFMPLVRQVREQAALPAEPTEELLALLNPHLTHTPYSRYKALRAAVAQGTTPAAGDGDYYSEEADDISQSAAGVGEPAQAEPMSDATLLKVGLAYAMAIMRGRGDAGVVASMRAILAEAGIKEKT